MRILMVNAFDAGGGAARAAARLHRGVRQLGIDARLLVQFQSGNAAGVECRATPVGRIAQVLRPHLDSLPVRCYPRKPVLNFSPAWLPGRVPGHVAAIQPDLVHLHWLAAGFVRVEDLKRLRAPLVWTLHDSWAFTGGCHVPFACTRYRERCGRCPSLGSARERDLSRWIWSRKNRSWQGLNLTVVSPSRWLAECARSSSLFRDVRVEVIPNGVDPQVFRPLDKRYCRDLLGLPQDKKLVLYGGAGIDLVPNKGLQSLWSSLRGLARDGWGGRAEAVVFGSSGPADPQEQGLPVTYLGWLHDEPSLVAAYCAADVFVAPSTQENLPNTILEAMACGTPCVAYAQGGMPDLVEHGRSGLLVPLHDEEGLAAGIRGILEDDGRGTEMGRSARQRVLERFALEGVAKAYAELYQELLGASGREEGF